MEFISSIMGSIMIFIMGFASLWTPYLQYVLKLNNGHHYLIHSSAVCLPACKSFGNVWKCAMVAPVSRPPKNCELWRRLKLVCAYASVSRCTLAMLTYQVLVKVEGD